MIMKYTVFENKETGGRFFSSYTEKDETGWYNIIGHYDTVQDAQAMCAITHETNKKLFLQSLPEELREVASSLF